jgi:hypothetical protein
MAGGQEQTIDAALFVTQRASAQGVSVTHWEFEGLVHTFFFVWRGAPQSKRLLGEWGRSMLEFVGASTSGKKGRMGKGSRSVFVKAKGLVEIERDVKCLVPFGIEELRGWMRERVRKARVPEFHKNLKESRL